MQVCIPLTRDIVVVVTRLAQWTGVAFALHDDIPRWFQNTDEWSKYKVSAFGLIDYAKIQALGFPISDHALFSRYRIEGVTIVGQVNGPGPKQVGLHHIS